LNVWILSRRAPPYVVPVEKHPVRTVETERRGRIAEDVVMLPGRAAPTVSVVVGAGRLNGSVAKPLHGKPQQ
jgi:hypothetical protein